MKRYVSSFDRGFSPSDIIGGYRDNGVFVSMPNFTLQKGESCLDSVVEKAIMKMQKKAQRHTRGLAAQFIDFLHVLEYQHINYTLE